MTYYLYHSFVESESSQFEDNTEIWNSGEEDGLLSDLCLNETSPTTDSMGSSGTVESHALARWIILFLMFIQATHKLSNIVISIIFKFLLFWGIMAQLL